MRPALVYFGVPAADGAVASLNPYPRSRINFPASRRNASRLLYRISLQLTPPRHPRTPARPPRTSRVGRGSQSRSVLHISFVPGCAPGGWARPGFVPPELQGRWPVARKLKLTVKNTRIYAADGGPGRSSTRERRLRDEHLRDEHPGLRATTSPVKRKQLFSYNCN